METKKIYEFALIGIKTMLDNWDGECSKIIDKEQREY